MCEASKFTYYEEKIAETADDFYPSNRKDESTKSTISGLLLSLNSKKTQLRSQEIEISSIHQKMVELDLQADKLTIANQYLSNEADAITVKQAELLQIKSDQSRDLKHLKEATSYMKKDLQRSDEEVKERRSYLASLQKKDQQLRVSIKAKEDEDKDVYSYNFALDLIIEKNDNEISKKKEQRDALAKTALTLQTFTKSFKTNIIRKEKELLRSKFQSGELENAIRTKDFERANLDKEKEKTDWQSKMYGHHNQQIENTNLKLKTDLEKMVFHLESLRKNNKHLHGCIKEYSETGITAAKKILQQANK